MFFSFCIGASSEPTSRRVPSVKVPVRCYGRGPLLPCRVDGGTDTKTNMGAPLVYDDASKEQNEYDALGA